MWRPPDWPKIVREDCYDGDCVYREIDTYEAGANAMLEALKTCAGEFIDAWGLPNDDNRKGTMVFLPDG